ncbi:MAG TPA: hypothetical protein VLL05_11395, partial [Terriglobales bacterium]|nr:hypothetical protein [Terriglobales bacterium]
SDSFCHQVDNLIFARSQQSFSARIEDPCGSGRTQSFDHVFHLLSICPKLPLMHYRNAATKRLERETQNYKFLDETSANRALERLTEQSAPILRAS